MNWKKIKGRGTGSLFSLQDRLKMMQDRTNGRNILDIAKETGCSQSTLVTMTVLMVKEGYLRRVGHKKYRMTEKGKEALAERPRPKMELVERPGGVELKITPASQMKVEETPSAAINDKMKSLEEELAYQQASRPFLLNMGWKVRLMMELEKAK